MYSSGFAALLVIAAHLGANPSAAITQVQDAKGVRAISAVVDEEQLRTITRAMAVKLTVNYDAMPIERMLREFQEKSKLNFHIDPKVEAQHGLDLHSMSVQLHARDIPLYSALNIILRDHELTWLFRDGVVVVAHESDASNTIQACVFDVAGLLPPADEVAFGTGVADSLIDIITDTIASTTWSKVGGRCSVRFEQSASVLVVTQTWSALEEIEALLANLRESARRQQKSWEDSQANTFRVALYRLPSELHDPFVFSVLANAAKTDDPTELRIRAQILENGVGNPQKLAEIIPQVIEPQSWRDKGGEGMIFAIGNALVIRQTERVHAELVRLLKPPKPIATFNGGSGMGGGFGMGAGASNGS
jgi:type II secretory pathway component GspD/PulD (secretin)